jgi:hypothetical protein
MSEFQFAGTVSWGTMREADLAPKFMEVLEVLDPDRAKEIRAEYEDLFTAVEEAGGWDEFMDEHAFDSDVRETVGYLVWEALYDALNDCAPDGMYFGNTEGDGSDYGFWALEPEED